MAAEAVHVSPEALRLFSRTLQEKVRPLIDEAIRYGWMPISAGPPFGEGYPSEDVAEFARRHAACAKVLTDFLAGVLTTVDALQQVAVAAAIAYEKVDSQAVVTADWIDRSLTSIEVAVPVEMLGNSGIALPEVA
jgi:hypothetical protein